MESLLGSFSEATYMMQHLREVIGISRSEMIASEEVLRRARLPLIDILIGNDLKPFQGRIG